MSSIERPTFDETAVRPTHRDEHDDVELAHRIEAYENDRLCTIHPDDADDEELITTWISARDDAFVDLDSMR